jgi:hypothetical protein
MLWGPRFTSQGFMPKRWQGTGGDEEKDEWGQAQYHSANKSKLLERPSS